MANYQEAIVKLTNTQLNRLKPAAKNKTGTILRMNKKNFADGKLSHKLFLTTRQTTKIRNTFANNMSTDTKLSKTKIFKIIQSGSSFGSRLVNLFKKTLRNVATSLTTDNFFELVSNLTWNATNKFRRKGKGTVRVGKWFTLFV